MVYFCDQNLKMIYLGELPYIFGCIAEARGSYKLGLGMIQISEKFRVSGSVGFVDLISRSGFVDFGYPSLYYIIRGYTDPDPDP